MDDRTFTIELIKALAWPITLLIVALVIRKYVIRLLPRLREVKYGGAEFSFGEALEAASDVASSALPQRSSLPPAPSSETDRINKLLELSPRAAVLEAFVPVQTALAALARAHDLRVGKAERNSATALADALASEGLMSEAQRSLFGTLRRLRNSAAHAPEFNEPVDSVREYIDLAARLAAALRLAATNS